jgi:hypothetical protein
MPAHPRRRAPLDLPAAMLARRQIDRPCFLAARDYQGASAKRLAKIEKRLTMQFGDEGVQIVRSVLRDGSTIEGAARDRGDDARQGRSFWAGLLQRCLAFLAVALGFVKEPHATAA